MYCSPGHDRLRSTVLSGSWASYSWGDVHAVTTAGSSPVSDDISRWFSCSPAFRFGTIAVTDLSNILLCHYRQPTLHIVFVVYTYTGRWLSPLTFLIRKLLLSRSWTTRIVFSLLPSVMRSVLSLTTSVTLVEETLHPGTVRSTTFHLSAWRCFSSQCRGLAPIRISLGLMSSSKTSHSASRRLSVLGVLHNSSENVSSN